jgi:hypothetical protein
MTIVLIAIIKNQIVQIYQYHPIFVNPIKQPPKHSIHPNIPYHFQLRFIAKICTNTHKEAKILIFPNDYKIGKRNNFEGGKPKMFLISHKKLSITHLNFLTFMFSQITFVNNTLEILIFHSNFPLFLKSRFFVQKFHMQLYL